MAQWRLRQVTCLTSYNGKWRARNQTRNVQLPSFLMETHGAALYWSYVFKVLRKTGYSKYPSRSYLARQISDLESSERKPRWAKSNSAREEQDGKSQQIALRPQCARPSIQRTGSWTFRWEQIFLLLCLLSCSAVGPFGGELRNVCCQLEFCLLYSIDSEKKKFFYRSLHLLSFIFLPWSFFSSPEDFEYISTVFFRTLWKYYIKCRKGWWTPPALCTSFYHSPYI